MMKKTLKELTIKNNFMFGAVMCDEDNCKGLLERVLQVPIQRVEVYVILIRLENASIAIHLQITAKRFPI